ncbi:glycosyltransferase [Pedobacter sp. SD-b]|uniref:Glycosyltransferase n=1 Tax=Pedobacter segetis TaxID=2793069 RepID=A0ABS1BGT0_9SPHI|nr:glycosyltransferase [Pedobacter segetis]MBK0382073.1 glycosyltransferase [Pedobacter segetis]
MTKNKKILIITHYSSLYGANISLLAFLENTKIPLKNFIVIAPENGLLLNELEKMDIEYHIHWFEHNADFADISYFKRKINAFRRIKILLHLYRAIKRYNPSIIYSNSSVNYYGFFCAKFLTIPHVWHLREFGFNDYNLIPDFGFTFQRLLLKINDRNIAISKAIGSYYKLNASNTSIVYNGVVSSRNLRNITPKKNVIGKLRFGVVGLMVPYKQQLEVIKAFQRFKSMKLTDSILYLVGEDTEEYSQMISEYIKKNNLQEDIIFTGRITERANIYDLLDVVISAAKFEGFGRTTAEAMSYGKVVLGYNSAGNAEVIQHNKTGLLFDSFDELSVLMLKLDNDKTYVNQLQNDALLNFNLEFTSEVYSGKIDEVILSQLE